MILTLYTHDELFELAKAIITNATGVQYPFNKGTFSRALLQVSSMFGSNASVQTLRLVSSSTIEEASGVILDRLGLESNTPRLKKAPARVRGKFIPATSPATTDYNIPQNTIVIQAASATQSEIGFETEAAATILTGQTESNEISLVAVENGVRANGIASGSSLDLKFAISGVSHLLTTTESGGGRDKQTEDEYRASIRSARRSYGEATWSGIESLLKTVKLSSGSRVVVSRLFEDFSNNLVEAIIDDGSGNSSLVGPIDTTTYPYASYPGSGYWEYTEDSRSIYLQLPSYHLPTWLDGVNAAITKNAGLLVNNTDYFVNQDTGIVAFAVPLVAGDVIRIWFTFYTGLVGLSAEYVNGIYKSSTVKGWRGIGNTIRIRGPASVTTPSVSATLIFEDGFDSQFGRELAASLILTYLNGLGIGDPARYDVINSICHKVPGVSYVTSLLLAGSTSDVSPTNYQGVVRGDAGTITV